MILKICRAGYDVPEETTTMPNERFPEWKSTKDHDLFKFYEHRLFEPGWAGELSDGQAEYIADVLRGAVKNPRIWSVKRLRRAWGFHPTQDFISEDAVREVAMYGNPDDPEHNTRLIETSILQELFLLVSSRSPLPRS